jgi:hypothetical protein
VMFAVKRSSADGLIGLAPVHSNIFATWLAVPAALLIRRLRQGPLLEMIGHAELQLAG